MNKLAIIQLINEQELIKPGGEPFDMWLVVKELHNLGKISNETIYDWMEMERSNGSYYGRFKDFTFRYEPDIDVFDKPDDDYEIRALRNVHGHINQELKLLKNLFN